MQWKVMTFNIQHGWNYARKDKIDLVSVADTVRDVAPDVVVFQEVRGDGQASDYTNQTEELAKLLGWNSYFAKALDVPNCGPYGNAILSPHKFEAETIAIPTPTVKNIYCEPRCILRAVFTTLDGDLVVYGSHFGLCEQEQANAVETVLSLTSNDTRPYVLMGDFNAEPDAPVLAPLYENMNDSAEKFTDISAKSFPSDVPDIKIDYIFTSKNMIVKEAEILPLVVSDHRPYIAIVEWHSN
ncbi:MAG: hypothetical protein HFE63_00120 [Clostridiales bacterium]|nr:hypothetical protein [Clostridiales bacterium]